MLKTVFLVSTIFITSVFLAVKYTPLGFVYPYFIKPQKDLKGTVEFFTHKDIKYFVYLPEGYRKNSGKQYPAIFHLHGAMPFSWKISRTMVKKDLTLIAALQEKLISERKTIPSVIIAPYDGMGTSMWSDSWTGDNLAETNLIRELIPLLRDKYDISKKRQDITLQGFSMGGFGAVQLGFKHPELFGKIISWDGAIHSWETLSQNRKQIADRAFRTAENFQKNSPWKLSSEFKENHERYPMDVYIIEGALTDYNQKLRNHLEKLGLNFTYLESGCGHDLFCMAATEATWQVYQNANSVNQ